MGIKDWFKSQLFGGKILRTFGSVKGKGRGPVGTELRIHTIEDNSSGFPHMVGIEIVAKSALSYQTMPITLPMDEARKLIDLLQNASQ